MGDALSFFAFEAALIQVRKDVMGSLEFVDVETARNAKGLRLVVLAAVPSPWSQAAKSILEYKGIPALAVRMNIKDEAVQNWTGISNAPVAMFEKEPPRAGWAEILALAERLRPDVPLIPDATRERVLLHGLSHEILGEGGLLWNARLFTIEASIASEGRQSFPLPVAKYLAKRYGYTPGCGPQARARVIEILGLLDSQLKEARSAGYRYFLGDRLSALDIYSAAAINMLALLPPDQCPAHPAALAGFEWLSRELVQAMPQSLVEHRDAMYVSDLKLPIQL